MKHLLASHVEDQGNLIVGAHRPRRYGIHTLDRYGCAAHGRLGPFVRAQHSVVLQLDAARAVHQDPKARRDATTGQTTE